MINTHELKKRDLYLNKLIAFRDTEPVKVVTGIRRCGKSSLLKLMAEYDTHGWNLGGAIRLWKHLSIHVFTREFTCVSAGLRYECTLIH